MDASLDGRAIQLERLNDFGISKWQRCWRANLPRKIRLFPGMTAARN